MALDTNISIYLVSILTKNLGVGTVEMPLFKQVLLKLANGTGAAQANKLSVHQGTIAASDTNRFDLFGGVTDAFGEAITFTRLKAILVVAAAGNTNNINVTRPATTSVPLFLAAGDAIPVLPGGAFLWMASEGIVVTAATDLLDLVNSAGGTSVSYDMIIIGCSA